MLEIVPEHPTREKTRREAAKRRRVSRNLCIRADIQVKKIPGLSVLRHSGFHYSVVLVLSAGRSAPSY
jgi:hypothetical protein